MLHRVGWEDVSDTLYEHSAILFRVQRDVLEDLYPPELGCSGIGHQG